MAYNDPLTASNTLDINAPVPGYTNYGTTQPVNVGNPDPQNVNPSTIGSADVQAHEQLGHVITYGIPGLAAGLVDTIGTSLGILKDSDVSDTLKNVFGPTGFGDWYSRNRDSVRTGSDIVGMFIPATLGMKVLKSARYAREAGAFGDFLKNSKTADVLLGSQARMTALETGISTAGTDAALQAGSLSGRTLNTAEAFAAKKSYYLATLGESVRQSVAFEALYAGMFNNSVLFPQDQSVADYAAWGLAGAGLTAGIDHVVARYAAYTFLRKGAMAAANLHPLEDTLSSTMYRPGARGVGIAVNAASINDELNLVKNAQATMPNAVTAANLATNATQSITPLTRTIHTQLDALAADKNILADNIKLTADQHGVFDAALRDNPMLLVDASNLSAVPQSRSRFYANIEDAKASISAALANAPTDKAQGLSDLYAAYSKKFFVLEGDGTSTLFQERAPRWLDTNSFADIESHTHTVQVPAVTVGKVAPSGVNTIPVKMRYLTAKSAAGNQVSIDDMFHIVMPNKPVQSDFAALQAVGSHMLADYSPALKATQFELSPQRNWRELDLLLNAASAHPDIESKLVFSGGFENLDDVFLHVTNERYKEFVSLLPKVKQSADILRPLFKNAITPTELSARLNMPAGVFDHPSPLLQFFGDMAASGTKDLNDVFGGATGSKLDNLQAAIRESAGITDPKVKPAITGNLFQQKDIKPVLVHTSTIPPLTRSDTYLQAASAAIRQDVVSRAAAVTADQSPVIEGVITALSGNPALDEARKVQNLFDGDLRGHGVMTYQDRTNQYNSTMKAAQLLVQATDNVIHTNVQELAKGLEPFTAQLRDPKNIASAVDTSRVLHAYRHGYVVARSETVPLGDDPNLAQKVTRYVLDENDPKNAAALHQYFGPDAVFPTNEAGESLMPDMALSLRNTNTPKPLVVSSQAGEAIDALSQLKISAGKQENILRQLNGMTPITLRDFHLPAPELDSETAWFVQNSQGKTINIYTRGAYKANQQAAQQAASSLTKITGEDHVAVSAATRQAQAAADGNYFDIVDYGDFFKKNAAMRGGLIESQIDTTPKTWNDMVSSVTNELLSLGKRTRALMFEPQLQYARAAASVTPKYEGGPLSEYSIFNRYINTVMSTPVRNPNGIVAKGYNAVQSALDVGLNVAYDMYHGTVNTAKGLLGSKYSADAIDRSAFEAYQEKAAAWSPFETAAQWATDTYKRTTPWTSKATITELSHVSNALALRVLNPGTALLNYLGVLTVMPAVVQSMRQRIGEDDAAYAARWALWGTDFKKGLVTFSPQKALARAYKQVFDGTLSEPLKEAARLGYTKPEFTSLDEILTQENLGKKGALSRWIDASTWIADHSEEQSRRVAWGVGYSLAKEVFGVANERSRFLFAQHVVNQVIGNYAPTNRPAIFQGAIGMPLGAFQTYMFNYYRRLFSYIENKDVGALATQMAAQGAVFGISGLPGWNMFNQYIGADSMKADTFESRINRNLAPLESELLLHGTVSNIPRIFGMDGIALYSRGGVDMTQYMPSVGDVLTATPTPLTYLYDANKLPPIQFLTNTANALQQTIGNILGGFSLEQQEQILSHYSTNRFFKNALDMAAGTSTDRANQMISDDTRTWIKLAATMAGSVPSQEREMQDAYFKQRIVERNQAALRAELNARTRSMFRTGNLNLDGMQDLVNDYIKSGGNPANFGGWLRNNAAIASQTKTELKLKELLNSGGGIEFQNMMAAMQHAPDTSDEEPVQTNAY